MNKEYGTREEMLRSAVIYARNSIREGQSKKNVEKALIEDKGIQADLASEIVRKLYEERQREYQKSFSDAGIRNMVIGGAICFIGIAVTIGSYHAAANSPSGGQYVIAWGAVIFGGIQFFKGLSDL